MKLCSSLDPDPEPVAAPADMQPASAQGKSSEFRQAFDQLRQQRLNRASKCLQGFGSGCCIGCVCDWFCSSLVGSEVPPRCLCRADALDLQHCPLLPAQLRSNHARARARAHTHTHTHGIIILSQGRMVAECEGASSDPAATQPNEPLMEAAQVERESLPAREPSPRGGRCIVM